MPNRAFSIPDDVLARTVAVLRHLPRPLKVAPVPGEPWWVVRLSPVVRAFTRVLLLELDAPSPTPRRRSRTQR